MLGAGGCYRIIMDKAGSAINSAMKHTKAAISILLPQWLATHRDFGRRDFLTYDTRASGPKFNGIQLVYPFVGHICYTTGGLSGTAHPGLKRD
jgi:hypothetical protein